MAKNEVKYEVKGDDEDVDKTTEKFKSLKSQIRETTVALQELEDQGKANSAEFKELSSKLDDLQETQERVAFQSKQLDDKLSAMPGPIGKVGNAMKTAGDAMNQFGKTTTIALGVVGLIITAFMAMYKSLNSTAEGQATLNKLSQAFSKVLGPLLAMVEMVAVPVFNLLADVVAKVADGMIWVAEAMGVSSSKIKEATLSVDEVQKEANKKEAERQKEAQKKRDEAAKERLEKQKEAQAAYQKALEEGNAVQQKAALALLDDEDRAVTERTITLHEDLNKLHKAGLKDTTLVWKAYYKDVNKLHADADKKRKDDAQKAIDDEIALIKSFNDKLFEISQALVADEQLKAKTAREKKYNDDKAALEADKEFIKSTEEEKAAWLAQLKKGFLNDLLTIDGDFRLKEEQKQKEHDAKLKELRDKRVADELNAKRVIQQSWVDLGKNIAQVIGSTANLLEQGSEAQKGFAVLQIVVASAASIGQVLMANAAANAEYMKAIATGEAAIQMGIAMSTNPITAAIGIAQITSGGVAIAAAKAAMLRNNINAGLQVGIVGVTAGAQIAAITAGKAATSGASAGGGSSSGGTSTGVAAPQLIAPQIGASTANPNAQLSQMLSGQMNQNQGPIRAYIVQSDIKNAQQFDARIGQIAKLG